MSRRTGFDSAAEAARAVVAALEDLAPVGAFGPRRVVDENPRVQISATEGLLSTDVVVHTLGAGTVTASDSMFRVQNGANAGDYTVLRSRRFVRYRPGQGSRYRWTAMFSEPVENSVQFAGAFTSTDAVGCTYIGTDFGFLLRKPGSSAIHRLTVNVGAGAGEVITITLDGEDFVLPATAGVLSAEATADYISGAMTYAGWKNLAPQAVGATVTFAQDVPDATLGAFAMSSTGSAAGSFATVSAGEPNVISEASGAFIPQESWNGDRLDGFGGIKNRSGYLLDPFKINVFEVGHAYLGGGPLLCRVMLPDGRWQTVHTIKYPGSAEVPNMGSPSLNMGTYVRSLGSTAPLVVHSSSLSAFTEGDDRPLRDSEARKLIVTPTTTEEVAIAFRVRSEFGDLICRREVHPALLKVTVDTGKLVTCAVYINPMSFSIPVVWQRHDEESGVDFATPAATQITGGKLKGALPVAGGSNDELDFGNLDVRLGPGDIVVVTTLASAAGVATAHLTMMWHEF